MNPAPFTASQPLFSRADLDRLARGAARRESDVARVRPAIDAAAWKRAVERSERVAAKLAGVVKN